MFIVGSNECEILLRTLSVSFCWSHDKTYKIEAQCDGSSTGSNNEMDLWSYEEG
jgi:hypothetical protein